MYTYNFLGLNGTRMLPMQAPLPGEGDYPL